MTSPQENVIYDEGGLLISQSRIVLTDGTTHRMSAVNQVRLEHNNRIQSGGWAAIILAPLPLFVTCNAGISSFVGDNKYPVVGALLLLIAAALLPVLIWGLANRRLEHDVTFQVIGLGTDGASRHIRLKFKQDEEKAGRVAEAINQAIIAGGATS